MSSMGVEKFVFEGPYQLIDVIHKSYFRPESSRVNNIFYRGVGDFDLHKLVPSAFRAGAYEKLLSISGLDEKSFSDFTSTQKRIYVEYEVARKFAIIADRAGLSVPIYEHRTIDSIHFLFTEDPEEKLLSVLNYWPTPDYVQILSLAQHYGVPTRLLDWTYDPLVALYFAAVSATKMPQKEGVFGIYMIGGLNLRDSRKVNSEGVSFQIKVAIPPRSVNPYMSAQSGLFTYAYGSSMMDENFCCKPLNELHVAHLERNTSEGEGFVFFGMNQTCARDTLKALRHFGYNETRIFPGYEGVARALLVEGSL